MTLTQFKEAFAINSAKPQRTHKVAGGHYEKDWLGMITWHPTHGQTRICVLNDASGDDWRKVKAER